MVLIVEYVVPTGSKPATEVSYKFWYCLENIVQKKIRRKPLNKTEYRYTQK